jgi:type II secretory pathway predicted ATPase ExeA/phage tail protein X
MYEEFYGFRERPFSLLPDPDFLYLSKTHAAALTLLTYSLTNGNALSVIIGEVGTGKTTLIRYLLNHLDKDTTVGLITNTHPAFEDLLQWILLAFDLSSLGKSKVERQLIFRDFLEREHARNRRAVLIIDEAQNMSSECLDELVLLSNVSASYNQVLQTVLIGQSGLREILQCPELENVQQHIGVDYHLKPLNREESHDYILHRLKVAGGKDPGLFSADARDTIFRYSGGIPRLINLLCETALVYGFSEQRCTIDTALIEAVARDKKAGEIVPLQDNLWDGSTGPPRSSVFSPADSVTQPYDVFLKHRDKVAFSTDSVAEEAFHAVPVQTPLSMPSNRTAAIAPKPTSPRRGKARQVALHFGLGLAVGLFGGYWLLSEKEDPRSAVASHVLDEERPAVETADLDSTTERPVAVAELETMSTTALTVPTLVTPGTLPSAPPMLTERGTVREAPSMGVATEPAPAEAPIEFQAMTAKTLSSTSTIPAEERGGTGAEKSTIAVKAGNTLTSIIRQVYGRYEEAILEAILRDNPEIQNPDLIKVGQVIRLPRIEIQRLLE